MASGGCDTEERGSCDTEERESCDSEERGSCDTEERGSCDTEERGSETEDEPCSLQHYCGVFGCVAAGEWPTSLEVSKLLQLGLVGLQHRGQEGAGMVVGDGQHEFSYKRGVGLVHNVFSEDDLLKLQGNLGIGHTRYSTMGGSDSGNIQPFIRETIHGKIALAHNGELINARSLRKKVLMHGVGLSCGSDSELITQLLTLPREADDEADGPNWVARIEKMMTMTPTSYSLVIMHGDRIYGVRDPFGNRPLCIGKLLPPSLYKSVAGPVQLCEFEAHGWVLSSESCTFSSMGAKYYREVLPGEIVEISKNGVKSCAVVPRPEGKLPAFCIFEYVYFARPDSVFESQQVYTVRQNCGRQLALEAPVEADLVSTVPESANPAALEYAHTLNIRFQNVLTKNRYVGRTFIQPTSKLRQLSVMQKFGTLVECYKDKKIVLIDDSIVRGTTMRSIVSLLKQSGAKEVHVRVASPPIRHPCHMGINIPTHDELIAPKMNIQQIAAHIMADSLQYLSVEGLQKAVSQGISGEGPSQGHCKACLTGDYPAALDW